MRIYETYIPALATGIMGLMLIGCQQAPPPATAVTPPANSAPAPTSSSSEHTTTTTETKQITPPVTNPDGTVAVPATETTKTETTNKEKKNQ